MPNAGVTNSYSTIAVVPEFTVAERVVYSPSGAYTCPAGKKAKVSGSMVLESWGSDATYTIALLKNSSYTSMGIYVSPGEMSTIIGYIIVEEGEIVTIIGDSGSTNATGEFTLTIQEISV